MIDYATLYRALPDTPLAQWREWLPAAVDAALGGQRHGSLDRWLEVLDALPALAPASLDMTAGAVTVGDPDQLDAVARQRLEQQLRQLHPWRKGPFSLYGVHIDTEWRSDWKWERLRKGIAPLTGRRVLDVGCGNGYHCWRMLGEGARFVLGIDPTVLYVTQFEAVKRLAGTDLPAWVLPLGIQQVQSQVRAFDTVFSMGVLYHRRSPLEHLTKLRGMARQGGEVVVETLVVDGGPDTVLMPEDRYAKMRNVWFIPSVAALERWLRRCGYSDVRVLDVTPTTEQEQRSTDWMQFESLPDFLDPTDGSRTVEGLPAPRRAMVVAVAP